MDARICSLEPPETITSFGRHIATLLGVYGFSGTCIWMHRSSSSRSLSRRHTLTSERRSILTALPRHAHVTETMGARCPSSLNKGRFVDDIGALLDASQPYRVKSKPPVITTPPPAWHTQLTPRVCPTVSYPLYARDVGTRLVAGDRMSVMSQQRIILSREQVIRRNSLSNHIISWKRCEVRCEVLGVVDVGCGGRRV